MVNKTKADAQNRGHTIAIKNSSEYFTFFCLIFTYNQLQMGLTVGIGNTLGSFCLSGQPKGKALAPKQEAIVPNIGWFGGHSSK